MLLLTTPVQRLTTDPNESNSVMLFQLPRFCQSFSNPSDMLICRCARFYNQKLHICASHALIAHSASLLLSPPGGLSAGQPDSKLPGAAVRPPSFAPPVGGYLPGTHLAELWPGALVWGSRQRPREALHSAFRSHSRGETSSVARGVSNTRKSLEMIKTFVWGKRKSSTA